MKFEDWFNEKYPSAESDNYSKENLCEAYKAGQQNPEFETSVIEFKRGFAYESFPTILVELAFKAARKLR